MKFFVVVIAHQPQPWLLAQLDRLSQDRRVQRYADSQHSMTLYRRRSFSDCTVWDIREAADMVHMGLYDGIIVSSPSVMERLDSWERVRRYLSEQGIPIVYASHVVEEG